MTGTALAIYSPQEQVALAAEVWPLANRLAETEFVPKPLRGRPEAVMACMLKGSELGLPLMQSLAQIHVIDGRPCMASELMRAVVLSRGHQIVVEDSTSTRCIIKGCRDGSTEWQRFTFTRDDAERAGLLGKDSWKKYPQAMLLARASALLCRAVFADCLAGISYTVEELNDGSLGPDLELLEQASPAEPEPAAPRRTRASRSRVRATPSSDPPPERPRSLRAAPPLPGEEEEETTVDQAVPRPGPQQIAIAFRAHGVETSEDRGRAIRQLLSRGPDLVSSSQLSPEDISRVLEVLNELPPGSPFPWITEDPEPATLPLDTPGGGPDEP